MREDTDGDNTETTENIETATAQTVRQTPVTSSSPASQKGAQSVDVCGPEPADTEPADSGAADSGQTTKRDDNDESGNGYFAKRYSRLSFAFLIVAVLLAVVSALVGLLQGSLVTASDGPRIILSVCGGLVLAALIFACLSLHYTKTRAGVVLLVLELVAFIVPLVWLLLVPR